MLRVKCLRWGVARPHHLQKLKIPMRSEQAEKLNSVHLNLLQEIRNAQNNLPENIEDVTEAFERHAHIISLLVRSLETMLKLEKQRTQEQTTDSDPQARLELLAGIEKRLAGLEDH